MRLTSGKNAIDDDAPATWLDDQAPGSRQGGIVRRHAGAAVAGVLCLALVAVPVSWVLASSGPAPRADHSVKIGAAEHRVIAALSATIDSGSFNMIYSEQPTTAPTSSAGVTTTTCPSLPILQAPGDGSGATPGKGMAVMCPESVSPGMAISGQGTIDINPFAMVASSNVPGIGPLPCATTAPTSGRSVVATTACHRDPPTPGRARRCRASPAWSKERSGLARAGGWR